MNLGTGGTPLDVPMIVLVGPTAIGKTELSLQIAERFGCEIISMDSMQVYRHMDIGTAKVSRVEQQRVQHHLIDIRNPDEQYDAASFVRDALAAIKVIGERLRIPLLTGGTGLYLSALLNGLFADIAVPDAVREHLRERLASEGRAVLHRELATVDPESASRVHGNDTQRLLRGLEIYHATGLPWSEHLRRQQANRCAQRFTRVLLLGLQSDRELLYKRIEQRTFKMMGSEFKQECESLLAHGYPPSLASMQSLGYRHMCAHLEGTWDLTTATRQLIVDTRRYAKRQMTWFRRYADLQWYDCNRREEIFDEIASFIENSSR